MQKISKPVAKKLFNAGKTVRVCPSKIAPDNIWGFYTDVNKKNTEDFEKFLTEFQFHNCCQETGCYPAYYIKEE